jgi:DNA-binding IclR family transcriptional regulator
MGEKGKVYEQIRQRGYDISMGEREPEGASVAAPVFGLNWRLVGSKSESETSDYCIAFVLLLLS